MRRKFFLGMLTAALLPLGLGNANARTFSDASLRGTCIWQSVAYPTTSGDQNRNLPVQQLSWHLSTLMEVAH